MEYLARKRKSWKNWFFFTFFIIILFICVSILYLRTSLPPLDGKIAVRGLSSPVKIIRDNVGIPHIYAKNKLDLYRAFGFTIASERLFQMEMARRMASGELAEIVGQKGLASDKMFRTFRLRSAMQEMFERKIKEKVFDPEILQIMEAFYDGVNQYQNRGNLPI
jgi:penicillin amidase